MSAPFILLLSAVTVVHVGAQFYGQPEQVHLAFGVDPSVIVVTWSTMNETQESVVEFGSRSIGRLTNSTNEGTQKKFTDGGSLHRVQYIHRVWIRDLIPGNSYVYHCGDPVGGWSDLHTFTTMKSGTDWSPRIVLYGDLGNVNPQSLPRLQEDVAKGMYDAALHVGDFAYDMDAFNAQTGDEFMRQLEPLAGNLPYMTCPGNHESSYNFLNYRSRFAMPTDEYGEKMFYSFNIGPVHILSFCTEYYFPYTGFGAKQIAEQYRFLEADLQEANKPENRAIRPWIITMGHKPMYCSNNDRDDCTHYESMIRTGMPLTHAYALEPLFYQYGVDIILGAHEHSYERLWPVYDRIVYNGSFDHPYTNPGAPVHIITGSAGCAGKHDPFKPGFPYWSAYHSSDYGYSRMLVYNNTHLYLEQVSDDQGGAIIDKIMVIKEKHQVYEPRTNRQWYEEIDVDVDFSEFNVVN